MAETTVPANGQIIQWERDVMHQSARESGFMEYMGTSPNSIIKVKKKLIEGGDRLRIGLVPWLKNRATGTAPLVGAEEALNQHWYETRPVFRRHAVSMTKEQKHIAVMDLAAEAKPALIQHNADDLQSQVQDALFGVGIDATRFNAETGTGQQRTFFDATAAQLNDWQTANARRIYAPNGAAEASLQSTLAATWATLDTTNDRLTPAHLVAMKKKARAGLLHSGQRAIRPYRTESGKEWYVVFLDQESFHNVSTHADMVSYLRDTLPREGSSYKNNPLYQDGDIVYRGLILREIPELPLLEQAGASSCDVSVVSLCGAEAMACAYGQQLRMTKRSEDDYGFVQGIGYEEMRIVEKLFFDTNNAAAPGEQHGILTGFFAGRA